MLTIKETSDLFLQKGIVDLSLPEHQSIHSSVITTFLKRQFIKRITHGVYECTEYKWTLDKTIFEAKAIFPPSVLCLFSALKFHGLTDEAPKRLTAAIPRVGARRKYEPPFDVYMFSPESYAFGIETHSSPDGDFKVYSVEKTLVDFYKFRNQFGYETFLDAVKAAKEKEMINLDLLWQAAEICRFKKGLQKSLEGIL